MPLRGAARRYARCSGKVKAPHRGRGTGPVRARKCSSRSRRCLRRRCCGGRHQRRSASPPHLHTTALVVLFVRARGGSPPHSGALSIPHFRLSAPGRVSAIGATALVCTLAGRRWVSARVATRPPAPWHPVRPSGCLGACCRTLVRGRRGHYILSGGAHVRRASGWGRVPLSPHHYSAGAASVLFRLRAA